jgi:hypothetical protein
VLFGQYLKLPLRLSLVRVPWVLLLTFHFKDRLKEDARFGQIVGTIASGVVFFVRGQDISDWSAKIFGIGGLVPVFAALAVGSYIGTIMLIRRLPAALRGEYSLKRELADPLT